MPEEGAKVPVEIAHVLFIDIVGYSKLLIEDQQAAVRELNQIARATAEYQAAEGAGKLVRIPTGDGMALVFFSTPEAPVRCAVEIARARRTSSAVFAVRMGIHSGPVTQSQEKDAEANIAGAGINLAQRVTDCGDAGHILLSQRVAEDIGQTREWRPYLHDIGESVAKHGVKLHLVNLRGEDFGNASLPSKLEAAATSQVRARRTRLSWQTALALTTVAALIFAGWFW